MTYMLEGKQLCEHLGVYTEKDIKETFDMPFRDHDSILSFCCSGELLSADIKEYLCSISLLPVYIYAQAPAPAVKKVRFLHQLRLNASIVGRVNSARRRDSPPAQIVPLDSTRGREQVYRNDKKPCQMIKEVISTLSPCSNQRSFNGLAWVNIQKHHCHFF